jgi:Uri superfamily endonuclease
LARLGAPHPRFFSGRELAEFRRNGTRGFLAELVTAGLKARLSRHFRRGKPVRWHVDQLTERSSVIGSWIFPGGFECELVRRFSQLPIPIPGFGSSDCAKCRSHLLKWSNGKALPLLDANVPARREGVRYPWRSAGHRTRAVEDW